MYNAKFVRFQAFGVILSTKPEDFREHNVSLGRLVCCCHLLTKPCIEPVFFVFLRCHWQGNFWRYLEISYVPDQLFLVQRPSFQKCMKIYL